MRIMRRIRRAVLLIANTHQAVRFAGGVGDFLRLVIGKLAARDWRGLIAWMISAVSYGHRLNATTYRRWLATRSSRGGPEGRILVVISTAEVAADGLPDYLRLVTARQHPDADLMVVTDCHGKAKLDALWGAHGEPDNVDAVVVDQPSIQNIVTAIHNRVFGDQSDGAGESRHYDLVSLLAPGCVPGEMPYPVAEQAVLYYGDEDRIDRLGERRRPFLKPDFSLDLLMYADYLSSCMTMTRSLARRLPRDQVADYHSLSLMLVEAAERVEWVDAIVAHRCLPLPAQPPVPAYLARFIRTRYGNKATVEAGSRGWICRFGGADQLVSVIIPTRDRADLLDNCVRGIFETNDGGNFEVIVVDNGSIEAATADWLRNASLRYPGFRVVSAPGEFNWSHLNNIGVDHANGDVFVFLNNDIEPRCHGWLSRLADVASRPDVGVAGGLLVYPTGKIQHAGVVIGFGGCADHIYRGTPPSRDDDIFVSPTIPRNVSAVTGACMAVARGVMEGIGPFDEKYRVTGGDVELCIRALKAGLLTVYCADAQLTHMESQSRGRRDPQTDVSRLRTYIATNCPQDRFYNPNLSMTSLYPSYHV